MNHNNGHYHPAAAMAGYQPQMYGGMAPPPQPYAVSSLPPPGAGMPINVLTCRDVLNGRGQGVQRHPGNIKYRTLVFINKVCDCLEVFMF